MATSPDRPEESSAAHIDRVSGPLDSRTRLRWRFVVLVVLVLLPVQLVFGRLVGETYPNVILPSFAEAPAVGETAVLMRPRTFVETGEGHLTELPLDDLLAQLPKFTHYETYKKTFLTYKKPRRRGEGGSWQRRLLNTMRASVPTWLQPRYSIPVDVTPDTVEWLRRRMRPLGFEQARAIHFQWINEIYTRSPDGLLGDAPSIEVIVESRVPLAHRSESGTP